MAVAPEAAEELPVLTYLYLVLISGLMWLLFRALKGGWQLTLGGVLEGLGNVLNYDYRFIHIHFGGPILALNHKIVNGLTEAAAAYEHAMGFWFWQMADLQLWIVDQTWKLTKDLVHWGDWVVHSYVPSIVHEGTHAVTSTVRTVVKQTTVIERKSVAVTRDVTIPHLGELNWINKHWKALTRAVAAAGAIALFPPTAIPRIWHGIDEIRASLRHILRRLSRVEKLLGVTAFAAAMAGVLGLPNPNCLRKGPIGKVSRRLCGLSSRALNDLLGLLVDVVLVSDICQVIEMLNSGLSIIEGPLEDFVGVVGGALCHGDFDPPPALAVAPLSLPPVTGISLSLAT